MQVIASGTRANGVVTNGDVVVPKEAEGLLFRLKVTAITNTPTLDVKLQSYDSTVGEFVDLTDSAGNVVAFVQKTGTGSDTLKYGPDMIEKLTLVGRQYSARVPSKVRAVATVGDAGGDDITFSLDVNILR